MRITRQDFLETNGGGYLEPIYFDPTIALDLASNAELADAYARVDALLADVRAAQQSQPQVGFSDVPVLGFRSRLAAVLTATELADWWASFLPFEAQVIGQINVTSSYALPLDQVFVAPTQEVAIYPRAPSEGLIADSETPLYFPRVVDAPPAPPAYPAHLVNTSVPLLAPLGPILPPGPIPRAIEDIPPPASPLVGPDPIPKADYYDAPVIYMPPIYPMEYDPTTGMITHSDTPIYFPPFDAPPKVTGDDEPFFPGVPIDDAPPVDVSNGEAPGILQTLLDDPSELIQTTALTQPVDAASSFTSPDWEIVTGPDGTTIMVRIGDQGGLERTWNDFLAWMKRDTIINGYPNWAVAGGGGVAGWWLLGGKRRR